MTDTVSGSYFASLAKARYLRLTTFKRKGIPVSAPVPGIVDGDRAYFGASSRSGTAKRLQHTDGVSSRKFSGRSRRSRSTRRHGG